MADYIKVTKSDDGITVLFFVENEKILSIGEKMNTINENAYMNGYNWDAFFYYYLANNAPDILEDLESDPEAGMYAAYYELTDENEEKANRFAQIVISLIENEKELYRIIEEKGDEIEWD